MCSKFEMHIRQGRESTSSATVLPWKCPLVSVQYILPLGSPLTVHPSVSV